ncbi:MAG: hypothetical protein D4R81_04065 [Nitrospiraceae bacterium]|nr:MAG: hypothetical protein D4R81_04065 [Nitrospiraceae bacterium]
MERFKFGSMNDEVVPQTPPEPPLKVLSGKIEPGQIRVVARLSSSLLESASRLLELSSRFEGDYRRGKDISLTCRAASTGVIVVACAAFEADLNEAVFDSADWARSHNAPGKARVLALAMKLNVRDRFDALAAAYGIAMNWGTKLYQSLDLVLSVRNRLLHHEVSLYDATEGHWPAKKLRDLVRRVDSPYRNIPGLEWHQHILTPAGAEWALGVICEVMNRTDEWWEKKRRALERREIIRRLK